MLDPLTTNIKSKIGVKTRIVQHYLTSIGLRLTSVSNLTFVVMRFNNNFDEIFTKMLPRIFNIKFVVMQSETGDIISLFALVNS